jgi:hypothetical protein
VVTNTVGGVTNPTTAKSTSAKLIVVVKPTINGPYPISVFNGNKGIFSLTATSANGSTGLSFQWYNKLPSATAFSSILGAISPACTTKATTSTDNQTVYQCVVTNTVTVNGTAISATATSSPATLTVTSLLPPILTSTKPSDTTISEGATATFSVVATAANTGGTLTYQWQKDSGATLKKILSGATGSSYAIPYKTSSADNGSIFRCIVTETVSSASSFATSRDAKLTIKDTLPRIVTQPANQTVTEGATATFTIAATGSHLTYLWMKNADTIKTATAATYTTAATQMTDSNATIKCLITNGGGRVVSNGAAKLFVIPKVPTITTNLPGSQTVNEGAKATFTISATGSHRTYQWRRNDTLITGVADSTYSIAATALTDNLAIFKCVVTNGGGSITSKADTLKINAKPRIKSQPDTVTIAEGGTAYFSIIATGAAPLTYQWQKDSANSLNFKNITDAKNQNNYTTPVIFLKDNGTHYRCIVTNMAGTVTSTTGMVAVSALAPTIVTPYPTDQTVLLGQKAIFTIHALGSTLSYQWYRNDTLIVNAIAASCTTRATTLADDGSVYKCKVTNGGVSIFSNPVSLFISVPPPVIVSQTDTQKVVEGSKAIFAVNATGAGLSYQWQKNGQPIQNATGAIDTTPAVTLGDNNALFQCIVKNSGGSVTSRYALLIVAPTAPVITGNPVNVTVTEGNPVTFFVIATGSNLTYQWQKNGASIATNATDSAYSIPSASIADNGALFQCIVTNPGGKTTSASAKLTVNLAAPKITTQPTSQSGRVGTSVPFSLVATGSNLSYQWQKGATPIANANAASYTTPLIALADNGTIFRCVVTNGIGSVTSNPCTLTVNNTAPLITTQPANQTASAGQTATFSIVASGDNIGYQWQKNGSNIPNASSASYTTPMLFRADSGSSFRCVVSNTSGSVTSSPAALNVNTPRFIVTIGNNGNGLTSPDGKVQVYYGDSLEIKAIALQYYRFSHWQTDSGSAIIVDSTNADTRAILTKGNATITAYFSLAACSLSVSSAPGGHVNPSGLISVGVGAPTMVKAIADNGYHFDHWSGIKGNPFIADSTSDSTLVALLINAEVRAIFSGALCTLTVKTAEPPDTAKTVLDTTVIPNDTIALVAPQMPGAAFIAWKVTSGSAIILDSSAASTRIVVKSSNVSVVALFGNSAVLPLHQRLIPSRFALRFQQATGVLFYDVPRMGGKQTVNVKIRLFDVRGRLLREIHQPALEPGYYHITLFGGHATTFRSAPLFEICVLESEGFKKAIAIRSVR